MISRRVARRHPALVAAAVLLVGGGGIAAAALGLDTSRSVPTAGSECGGGVSGPGFHVFACMSGGARAGHPHPKELLVVRKNGSSVAYPDYGGQDVAASDGEVVASYDDTLVRVTSRRLVPLVTQDELSSALHRRTILIMGFGRRFRVDARGDLYFFASTLIRGRHGCQSRYLERLSGGAIRQIRASSAPPNDICY
jgi:hypothetical protein